MMSFLRCNKCFEPLKSTNPPFSLTQCGHIFCSKCIANEEQCFECKSTGIEFLPLTQPLSDRVSSLFMPAAELFEQSLFTYKFQNSQMMISMRHFEEMEKKYNGIKMAYWKLRNRYIELSKAHKHLQNSRIQCQTTQNITPSQQAQNYVIPRSYFPTANYIPNINQRNHIRQNQMIGSQMSNEQAGVRFNTKTSSTHAGYQTDDSMSSMPNSSHVGSNVQTPPITPNVDIFRIPNVRNLPRSTHASSDARGNSTNSSGRTPLARNQRY